MQSSSWCWLTRPHHHGVGYPCHHAGAMAIPNCHVAPSPPGLRPRNPRLRCHVRWIVINVTLRTNYQMINPADCTKRYAPVLSVFFPRMGNAVTSSNKCFTTCEQKSKGGKQGTELSLDHKVQRHIYTVSMSCAVMSCYAMCVCVMHDQYHAWPLYTFLHVCDDPSHWLLYPAPPHRRMKTAVFKGDNQHRVNTRMHKHTYSALSWHVCTGRTSSHTQRLHAMCRTAQSVRVSLAIALRGSSATACCCRCLS